MSDPKTGLSRRRLFQAAAAVATALGVAAPAEAHRKPRRDRRDNDDDDRELVLVNGRSTRWTTAARSSTP